MNWFLIALINPITHAFINHFDKFLLSKYIKNGSVGALILFSSLFAVVTLPVIYLIDNSIFSALTVWQAIVLMVNGAVLTGGIIFYLYALDNDEASYIAPFGHLIPLFGLLLGYFILHEVLNTNQILGGALILGGGLVLSLDLTGGKQLFKWKVVGLVIVSTFLYALNAVIFKFIAVELGFWQSLFWDMVGKFVFGCILFICVRNYREQFLQLIASNGKVVFGLNVFNEALGIIGEWALVLAVLYAPVALVQSVGGLQPLFVFIIGIILTLFFPKFGQESMEKKYLLQKIIGIIIVTLGVFCLEF